MVNSISIVSSFRTVCMVRSFNVLSTIIRVIRVITISSVIRIIGVIRIGRVIRISRVIRIGRVIGDITTVLDLPRLRRYSLRVQINSSYKGRV